MIPTRRYENARCLQSYAQQLKMMHQREAPFEPGERKRGAQTASKSSSSIAESVKRRRTAKKEAQEQPKACDAKKAPSIIIIQPKRNPPAKKKKKKDHNNSSKTVPPRPKEATIVLQATERAKKAVKLANEILQDSNKARALLLQMTQSRRGTASNTWPPRQNIIPSAFVWSNYPPLEAVLMKNEKEYYQISIANPHSDQQVQFKNRLVQLVQESAAEHGLEFDSSCFSDDKILRHRIRDYYKTHTMNAKKRLMTMVGNPTKPSNVKNLSELLEFLEELAGENHDAPPPPTVILEKNSALPRVPRRVTLRIKRRMATTIRICNPKSSL